MPTIAAVDLTNFATALFSAAGLPPDEATAVASSLVESNLCGHDSHGVIRLVQYLPFVQQGRLRPGVPLVVEKQTPAIVVADGGWGFGQIQARRLLELMLPRVQQIGLCAGTLRQCGHIGRLGEYGEWAVSHGLAFLATVNNHGFGRGAAPPGGIESRIGTNPICIAAPHPDTPLILDIGTTVVAEGKVRVAFNKGIAVPEGWLLDARGQPTTDPGVLYREPRGSLLPLGGQNSGYKGFGLGLLLDVLAGGLSGAPCSHPELPSRSANAVFFLLLDIEQFAGRDHFLAEVRQLSEDIRTCPRAPGVTEILLPGDPERRERQRRRQAGIALDEGTWQQLSQLAQQLSVTIPPSA